MTATKDFGKRIGPRLRKQIEAVEPAKPDGERMPWHQQPGETDHEFEHFLAYRDMPKSTSGTGFARRKKADLARKMETKPSQVNRYAMDNNWDARVGAWDLYMRKSDSADVAIVRRAFGEGLRNFCNRGLEIAIEQLEIIGTDLLTVDEVIRLGELSMKMADRADKIEQPAIDRETEVIENELITTVHDILRLAPASRLAGVGQNSQGSISDDVEEGESEPGISEGPEDERGRMEFLPEPTEAVREGSFGPGMVGGPD
jgi:hypothetical protein